MKLSERCYAVTGLGYTAPWSVNAGFIVGRETTLIVDTGASTMSAATIHGYASAVRPGNRLRAINTEKHFDHIGGNSYFRSKGVDIYGHTGIRRTEAEFFTEVLEFNNQIPNSVRRERMEAGVFYSGTKLENPNRPVTHETSMELGDCETHILLTPGHTPTNLSVYVPQDGVLYCGDCLVNGYLPNLECGRKVEWRHWLESLAQLERLSIQFVVPGHGPIAAGKEVERLFQTVRAALETAITAEVAPTCEAERAGTKQS